MNAMIAADFPTSTRASYGPQTASAAAAPKPQAAQTTAPTTSQPGDTIALSPLAPPLSGDALKLFNSFSTDDQQKLTDLVAEGTLSGEELNDGLTGALKGQRKRQLWALVFEKNQALPVSRIDAPGEIRDAATREIEALNDERMRVLREMSQRLGKPGAEALAKVQAEYLHSLADRSAKLHDTLIMDITKPFTLIGASGSFFSANWQSESETTALAKLTRLGALSPGMNDVIATNAKKTAAENLIVRQVNRDTE